ncbi:hypothetical protein [Candidatus Fukatsuia endosymbiont of Tuberolachnus salignus]|uniref:hypothetical protein n=1 Tax=Candidatus Fukatsuia endosymbiont of Tuberolachnus salignus TaxID=3077957 RepID=UPI00313EDFA3
MSLYIEIDNRYVITRNNSWFILHEKKIDSDTSKNVGDNYLKLLAYYSSFSALIKGLIRHHGLTLENKRHKDKQNEIQRIGRACHEVFKPVPLLDPDEYEIGPGIKRRLLLPNRITYIEHYRLPD